MAKEIPELIDKLNGMTVAEEIGAMAKASPKLKEIGKGKNLAHADYFLVVQDLKGFTIKKINGKMVGLSGDSEAWDGLTFQSWEFAKVPKQPPLLTPIEGFAFHSENRIFESLISKIEELLNKPINKNEIYAQIKGEILLFSEKTPCTSCNGIINQLTKIFPNLKLRIIWAYEKSINN